MMLTLAGSLLTNNASAWENVFPSDNSAPTAAASAPSPAPATVLPPDSIDEESNPLPATQPSGLPNDSGETGRERSFHFHVSLGLRGVYDDNINISRTNREADYFVSVEPDLLLGFGDIFQRQENFISLVYLPNAFVFATHSEDDALQHILRLEGQYRFPRLTLNLLQDVEILDGSELGPQLGVGTTTDLGSSTGRVNLDVGARTRVDVYNTRVAGNYSLTGKTFLTGALSYSLTDYQTFIDSSVISANTYFNYTYSPKLTIGVGLAGGYDAVGSPSQNQSFEQVNGNLSYELTGKVSATLTGGVEFRQYGGSGGGNSVSPVFEGALLYQPFDGTNLSLTLWRRVENSAVLAGQDYYNTSVVLRAEQRLLQRFFFGVSIGYENSTYFSTANGIASNRDDNYYFIQPSVNFNVTRFWTAGIYYLHRESDSSLDAFSFYDNQIGLQSALSF